MVDNNIEKLSILDIANIKSEELKTIIDNYNREQLENLFIKTKDEILKNRKIREIQKKDDKKYSKKHPIIFNTLNILGKVTGRSAAKDYKAARNIKPLCNLLICVGSKLNEEVKKELNSELQEFGKYKVETLKHTLGVFLSYIREIDAKNKLKEYNIPCSIESQDIEEFTKTFEFTMEASDVIKGTVKSAGLAAAGSAIVPQIVMNGVLHCSLVTASTGAAITSLHGAAATNAALAVLGGGSIAAGGGGIAAGAAALSAIGATAGGIAATICAGSIASAHFAKKLTEAVDFEKSVLEYITDIEKSWEAIKLIYDRISELQEVMKQLENRIEEMLELFEPLVSDFDFNLVYHLKIFNKTGVLIKTISEIANAPILSNDGSELSSDTQKIIIKSKQITNEELING